MPTPTGSRGLPPAESWQDWFTIRFRTWANVIKPEFEAKLVKVLGQQADLSKHGAADRQLAHEICFNIHYEMLPYLRCRGSVVGLCDPESATQRNPCQYGGAHGSTSREVRKASPLQRQNEAVVDVETVAHRPQGVARGRKFAIQERQ